MNVLRISSILAVAVVFCACAALTEGARGSWRDDPLIQEYLQKHPLARRMTQMPGSIIDIIIDIILILLRIILNEDFRGVTNEMNDMRGDLDKMKALLGGV